MADDGGSFLVHASVAVPKDQHPIVVSAMMIENTKAHRHMGCLGLLSRMKNGPALRENRMAHPAASSSQSASEPAVYPHFPPWIPQRILAERVLYMSQIRARSSRIPEGVEEDSPLFSIHRLYERLVLDDTTGYRNEIEYFWWHRNWPVSEIPDPKDPDPARYAMLAGIPCLLVRAFNNNIAIGLARYTPAIISPEKAEALRNTPETEKIYESEPQWALDVPRLKATLEIPVMHGPNLIKPTDEQLDPAFERLNIRLAVPHVLFT